MKKQKEGYKETDIGVVPIEWDVITLSDIGQFRKGRGIKKDEVLLEGLPCIRYGEIYTTYNNLVKKANSFISKETAKDSMLIEKNEIVFAGSGETIEDIGKAVVYLNDEPCYVGGDTIIMKPTAKINSIFLSYYLATNNVTKQKRKIGQGNSVVHIYVEGVKSIKVVIPSQPEQQQIAEILVAIDEHIEKLDKIVEDYQRLKKGIMKKLLSEGIGHIEFINTEIGTIPKEWEVKRICDVAPFISNGFVGTASPYYTEDTNGTFYLMGNNIRENCIDKTSLVRIKNEFVEKYPKSKVYEGDMLTVQSGHIGTSCIVTKEFDNSNCHAVIITRFNKDIISSDYVAYYLNSDIGKAKLRSIFVGTTIKHINTKDLRVFQIPVPSLVEQKQIVSILSELDNRIELYQQEREDFIQLKKALMEQLLTGKIRVIR